MPQARRSTSTRSSFKEPAALKRLTTALDTAQKALAELSKGSGRDVGKGAGDLYKDLRSFVSNARRDSNKVAKALQREFEQAQKQLAKAASGSRSSGRSTASRSTTSKRSTSSRSTSSTRSASSRASSGRASAKKAATGGTRRASSSGGTRRSTAKRGSSKS